MKTKEGIHIKPHLTDTKHLITNNHDYYEISPLVSISMQGLLKLKACGLELFFTHFDSKSTMWAREIERIRQRKVVLVMFYLHFGSSALGFTS